MELNQPLSDAQTGNRFSKGTCMRRHCIRTYSEHQESLKNQGQTIYHRDGDSETELNQDECWHVETHVENDKPPDVEKHASVVANFKDAVSFRQSELEIG